MVGIVVQSYNHRKIAQSTIVRLFDDCCTIIAQSLYNRTIVIQSYNRRWLYEWATILQRFLPKNQWWSPNEVHWLLWNDQKNYIFLAIIFVPHEKKNERICEKIEKLNEKCVLNFCSVFLTNFVMRKGKNLPLINKMYSKFCS